MKNTFSQIRQANTRMRGEQTEKKKARRRKALTHAQSHEIEKRNTSSIVHEHVRERRKETWIFSIYPVCDFLLCLMHTHNSHTLSNPE